MAEAEAGNAVSQYNLGLCYANGNGVEVDLAEAVRWLRKAAERGLPEVQFHDAAFWRGADARAKRDLGRG